jgi:isopentenyl phosphate kinase
MDYLALALRPARLLLAGETPGVLDAAGHVVPHISRANYEAIRPALGGSRGADVTGGMASKVAAMLDLADKIPGLTIHIFSGLESGVLEQLLASPSLAAGTRIG